MEKLKDFVFWLLFIKRCKFCGKAVKFNQDICPSCSKNLPQITGERCFRCGETKKDCKCKNAKNHFDGIVAPYYYEDNIKLCIRRLKFYRQDFLAKTLGTTMADTVKKEFNDFRFDFVTYVPFYCEQKIRRDYNQSELLAEKVALELNVPFKDAMVKTFKTNSQHKMPWYKRKTNVFGAYGVKNPKEVKNKNILLVDDVKTSGSTLNECAKMLKLAGCNKVYCVVAAVTPSLKK